MALTALFRELFADIRQKDATISALLNIAVRSQPLQHFRYGRLSHSKTQCYIDLPGLAPVLDKIRDQLDIILDQLRPPVVTGSPETLHVSAGVNEQTLGIAVRFVIGTHMVLHFR